MYSEKSLFHPCLFLPMLSHMKLSIINHFTSKNNNFYGWTIYISSPFITEKIITIYIILHLFLSLMYILEIIPPPSFLGALSSMGILIYHGFQATKTLWLALAGVAQLIGALSRFGWGFDSQSGCGHVRPSCQTCRVPGLGTCTRGKRSILLSFMDVFLSPSLSLSEKTMRKMSFGEI